MIKLFRTIRKDLMEQNKTGKYFKYAIGEIVLVVIGILIALSINNWNETRKEKVVIETIYETVKNDLKNDIAEGKSILKKYAPFEPYFNKFLNGSFTEEDYDECKCDVMFLGFYDLYLNKRGFEMLKQTNNELIIFSDLPDNILNFYTEYFVNFELTEESLNEFLHEQIRKLSEYNWWSDYFSGIDETGFRDYLVNNKNAKNELATFSVFLIQDYLPTINAFIIDAEALVTEIEQR